MILSVASLAQSQDPVPSPSFNTQNQQNQTQGTEQIANPPIQISFPNIANTKTPPNKENRNNNRNEDKNNPSFPWWRTWQIVATLALVLIGAAQALFVYLQIVHHRRIDITLCENQWGEMAANRIKLYCHGRIECFDIFGKIHEAGFCWELENPQGSTMTISDNKDLNYYT